MTRAGRAPHAETKASSGKGVQRVAVVGNQWETAYRFRGPLVEAFMALGLAVDVVGPAGDDSYRQRLEELGARTHGVAISRAGLNPLRELTTLLAIARLLRRLRPDLSFAYFAKPVIYGSFAAALARVPRRHALIAGLGYALPSGERAAGLRRRALAWTVCRLYRLALRLNRRVFFQNPDDLREFVDAGLVAPEVAVRVNGTGVDLEFYASSDPVTKPVTFVLAARLITEKGIREYVEAARVLRERGWAPRCILLGGLDDNPSALAAHELRAWVDEGTIEWPGAVDDVRPWLHEASVYVLPSWYREGVPRSIQEAMAIGRAVITTDAPGCRETVEEGRNGFLVPVRDVPALVDAMERFLRAPDAIIRMGRESRRLAEERFDVRRINRCMLEQMGLCGTGAEA